MLLLIDMGELIRGLDWGGIGESGILFLIYKVWDFCELIWDIK